MLDDTRPDSEFEAEQEIESLPDVGPLPPDDFSGINDWDPRITERQPVEDYGIPGIDLDNSGQIKVPKLKPRGPKADYCLLEEARGEFFMGMNMDVPTPIAWLWPQRIAIGKLTLIEGESNSGTSFVVTNIAARFPRRRGACGERERRVRQIFSTGSKEWTDLSFAMRAIVGR